ncbi:MAG: zinc ABC transporter substrate-binding protein ZnuA [Pantoea sp. Brub]|nr:zinc ABC transporter substrate-binding protein ZnuA [Pantoea sp. Brub]
MIYSKKILVFIQTCFLILTTWSVNADIVVSLKPIGFIVSAIADGVTKINVIVPDGASEHNYILRPSDIKKIKNADLIVWSGPGLDFFMNQTTMMVPVKKHLIISNIKGVNSLLIKIDNTKHDNIKKHTIKNILNKPIDQQLFNIHLWMSPKIAKKIAIAVHNKLIKIMPDKKRKLDDNLKLFIKSINNVSHIITKRLHNIKNKGYFVFHDAYAYFEQYYGLSPLGYFTNHPEINFGIYSVNHIKNQLINKKVYCVFSEPQFKSSIIDNIIKGMKVHKGILDPLGMNIKLSKNSYIEFLLQLTNQYKDCLDK